MYGFGSCFWKISLFIFQMLFHFPVNPSPQKSPITSLLPLLLWGFSSTHQTTPTYPHSHSPTLGHQAFTEPRASPLIDAWKGYPLLHTWQDQSHIQSPMQTLLWMARSTCCQELNIAVSWKVLSETDKKRGWLSQPTIELSMDYPIEELEKWLKELKGFATS